MPYVFYVNFLKGPLIKCNIPKSSKLICNNTFVLMFSELFSNDLEHLYININDNDGNNYFHNTLLLLIYYLQNMHQNLKIIIVILILKIFYIMNILNLKNLKL